MKERKNMKRRDFITKAGALGTSMSIAASGAHAMSKKESKTTGKRKLKREFIRVGMIGLGPYSHAMAYTQPLNEPSIPPRTRLHITAVWHKADWYRSSLKGTEEFINKRMDGIKNYMSIEKFTEELGVEHIVEHPEDMMGKVDAVFITDPEDSLNLARPFLLKGMPVFINRPIAWNMSEAHEIVRLAKEHGSALITGSCVPWMAEFQVAKSRIDPKTVQHFYTDGSTANFCSYMPHIFETALAIVGGTVTKCSTHGMTWPADEDPLSMPPIMTHMEFEKIEDRPPVLGVASSWYGKPMLNWIKVHMDKDVVEQGVFREGSRGIDHDEHLWMPLLRVITRAFETGKSPEDGDYILNKVATNLMAHKSGTLGGIPVSRSEIEDHSLPRYETEKA